MPQHCTYIIFKPLARVLFNIDLTANFIRNDPLAFYGRATATSVGMEIFTMAVGEGDDSGEIDREGGR